jgi:hypothetical protein
MHTTTALPFHNRGALFLEQIFPSGKLTYKHCYTVEDFLPSLFMIPRYDQATGVGEIEISHVMVPEPSQEVRGNTNERIVSLH